MKRYLDLFIVALIIAATAVAQPLPDSSIAINNTNDNIAAAAENTPEPPVHEGQHLSTSSGKLVNGKTMFGIASFYSRSLEGSETATGETFHHANMTGASNFFKLNTWVRVTNLNNGKSIIVRINDRMADHMAKIGRVVDLTKKGAVQLDFVNSGIVKVKVEEVSKETTE